MPLSISPAARCLDALFRYELAAARCYLLAETFLIAERDTLSTIRRSHEVAAATLHNQILILDHPPSDGPGLWGALPTLVTASTALCACWAVLTVLIGSERHGIATYSAACRIPVLPSPVCIIFESTLLPMMNGHVRTLEQLTARSAVKRPGSDEPVRLA
ncbi:MAG TPA: hypothetical protein VM533_16725 [Fimbriiglobus sp.]|jgi:hypothetical protein|nr:hypothetical protein [Fimbriiglobus sp.]